MNVHRNAGDLVGTVTSKEELRQTLLTGKSALVMLIKTTVLLKGTPCGICTKDGMVHYSSTQHSGKWIHKRCSGIKGSKGNVQNVECSSDKADVIRHMIRFCA